MLKWISGFNVLSILSLPHVLWFVSQPLPTLPTGRQVPLIKGVRFSQVEIKDT